MRLSFLIQQPVLTRSRLQRCMSAADTTRAFTSTKTQTCRRCKQQFTPDHNHAQACQYHSAIFTGGEVSKAIGFCRASAAPEHQLVSVVGRTGLMRFWDCCGSEDPEAPGCCTDYHRSYDDPDQ